MSLLGLILLLVLVGVVLYLVPMDAGIKRIIVIVVAVIVALLLIGLLFPGAANVRL